MLIRGYAAMAAAAASGSPASVAIVGGGVAGVSAAKLLATRGVPSVIYDQREMLGGRLGVTRLADGSYCGSACCYMKGSAAHGFQEQLLNWEAAGLVEEWDPVCASFSHRKAATGHTSMMKTAWLRDMCLNSTLMIHQLSRRVMGRICHCRGARLLATVCMCLSTPTTIVATARSPN